MTTESPITHLYCSLTALEKESRALAQRWQHVALDGVWGVPRGGIVPALMVARHLGLEVLDQPTLDTLVVDDLVDSGRTAEKYMAHHFDALFRKPHTPPQIAPSAAEMDGWLVFPWEGNDTGPVDAVVRLLEYVGEDPTREGLVDTPKRVLKALRELTSGYKEDPIELLSVEFDEASTSMIVVSGIEFASLCEHHMLPFTGTATIGYLPRGGVVGLSKLARLVEVFAKRLQVQERMTHQIVDAMVEALDPLGAGVVITSHHSCMGMRGVRKPTATMTTRDLYGCFLSVPELRAEFLAHHEF